jgi:hypothetical protein
MLKTKPPFVYFLGIISLTGILFNIISLVTGWPSLPRWALSVTMIVLGVALIIESQIRALIKGLYDSGKIDSEIFGHIATGFFGVLSFIVGLLVAPIFMLDLVGGLLTLVVVLLIFLIISILIEMFLI